MFHANVRRLILTICLVVGFTGPALSASGPTRPKPQDEDCEDVDVGIQLIAATPFGSATPGAPPDDSSGEYYFATLPQFLGSFGMAYPGTRVDCYGDEHCLQYIFRLGAGADPSWISLYHEKTLSMQMLGPNWIRHELDGCEMIQEAPLYVHEAASDIPRSRAVLTTNENGLAVMHMARAGGEHGTSRRMGIFTNASGRIITNAITPKATPSYDLVNIGEGSYVLVGDRTVRVDLGPDGGEGGGRVVAAGTPEDVAKVAASHTGRWLKPYVQR